MTYDPKRTSCERKLEHCEHQRINFMNLYHGAFLENKKLKGRISRLKKAQRAAQLPFKGAIQ